MNYYEILEIPVSFSVDREQMTKKYLEKQSKIHPDAQKSLDLPFDSATLNIAYKTLSDLITRGEYFLKIHGYDTENLSSESAKEMFSLRERFEEIKDDKDKEIFKEDLKIQLQLLIDELFNLAKNLDIFREKFVLAKFLNSFLEKISLDVYSLY